MLAGSDELPTNLQTNLLEITKIQSNPPILAMTVPEIQTIQ